MKVNHFFFFFLLIRTGQKKKVWNPHDHSFHPFFHFLVPLVQYNQLMEQLSIYQGNFFFFFQILKKIYQEKYKREKKFPRKLRYLGVVFMCSCLGICVVFFFLGLDGQNLYYNNEIRTRVKERVLGWFRATQTSLASQTKTDAGKHQTTYPLKAKFCPVVSH